MRVWKQYSRYARDGEKTVYCQKGKHSVYYGDAVISFKPSKLIWCNECKETYYKVNETLFENQITEEVKEMKKECLHKLQNKICKFCGVTEADLYAKQEKILEQWHNETKEHIWPVEIDMVGQDKHGQVLVTCTRCNGSGECSFHLRFGTTCFGCSGTGVTLDPLMTQPQIKFIRQLFKSVKDKMTIDEQEELIQIMKSAINGTKRVNKHWASQTIDKLKNLETERSIS